MLAKEEPRGKNLLMENRKELLLMNKKKRLSLRHQVQQGDFMSFKLIFILLK